MNDEQQKAQLICKKSFLHFRGIIRFIVRDFKKKVLVYIYSNWMEGGKGFRFLMIQIDQCLCLIDRASSLVTEVMDVEWRGVGSGSNCFEFSKQLH
jgi:hypothetical protein